jgi:methyl-accepting chemotaxis protein
MKRFRNARTSFKLLAGFALVAALTVLVGIVGATQIGQLEASVKSMYVDSTVAISDLSDARSNTALESLSTTMRKIGEASQMLASSAEETTANVGRLGESSEQIGEIVRAIQAIAEQTNLLALVGSMTRISNVINRINDAQATIAGAVEEQTAVTQDIARNVAEAADGRRRAATGVATTAHQPCLSQV